MDKQPEPAGAVERSFELERIIFFSDAVIAIAITLLAIELRPPDIGPGLNPAESGALLNAILDDWPRFLAFVLSFYIIAVFWIAHHRYFRYIKRYDEALIRINIVFLFFIVLVPFSSALLGEYGNLQTAIIIYALNLLGVGLAGAWLWNYASHDHRLVEPSLDPVFARRIQLRAFATPLASVIVILLTFIVGAYASFGWFLIFVFQFFTERHYRQMGMFK